MNKLILFAAFILPGVVQAQSLNSPESVEYDAQNNRWLISNNGANQILARDAGGALSLFSSSITSGPHGLEIVGDTLYACDGGNLKLFNLSTGTLLGTITIGGTFLNGITHDNSGNLYVTDFTARNIYRIKISTQQVYTYVSGLTKSPNGIVFDEINSRLVFVNWGSNAPISVINMSDSTTSTITSTTLGNCDGITMNCEGQFYVSSWSPNRISRFDNDFVAAPVNMVTSGLSSPADIFFAKEIDVLGVPNSGNNTVGLHTYISCSIGFEENEIEQEYFILQSNPGSELKIVITNNIQENDLIYVRDLNGKIVYSFHPNSTSASISLENGIYFIEYISENFKQVKKFVIIK